MIGADLLAAIRPPGTPVHVHVHLPRAAGSALQRRWTERGGWFLRLPLDESSGNPEEIQRRLLRALERGTPVLVGGHVPYRQMKPALQEGDVVYAMVREPVERALSLYRYAVSMCQRGEIVNYPGDSLVREQWGDDWRVNVRASGLDPDRFSLEEFLDAGLCPDDSYRAYFGEGGDPARLGEEMLGNGFVVPQGRVARGLLGNRPVNRTVHGEPTIMEEDRRLIEARLGRDATAFASIAEVFLRQEPRPARFRPWNSPRWSLVAGGRSIRRPWTGTRVSAGR